MQTRSDSQNFQQYAKLYDLFNDDRPYAEEADYVSQILLHEWCFWVQDILEFGSGTGRHGRELATLGFNVTGVDRSREMLAQTEQTENFRCESGDIRSIRLDRKFDAVVALFHVMSYQRTEADFFAALDTAHYHLESGGLFFFDVWHGPAVLTQKPQVREKSALWDGSRVFRKATPELRENEKTVVVNYQFTAPEMNFTEQHFMRYFSQDEIINAAVSRRFDCLSVREMLTGAIPSTDTWSVGYLLQKR